MSYDPFKNLPSYQVRADYVGVKSLRYESFPEQVVKAGAIIRVSPTEGAGRHYIASLTNGVVYTPPTPKTNKKDTTEG